MGNSLVRSGVLVPSRIERQLSRALEQIDADTAIAVRRDQARLERVAGTAERGMARAAQLGALVSRTGVDGELVSRFSRS